jgi:hypothetical protein
MGPDIVPATEIKFAPAFLSPVALEPAGTTQSRNPPVFTPRLLALVNVEVRVCARELAAKEKHSSETATTCKKCIVLPSRFELVA